MKAKFLLLISFFCYSSSPAQVSWVYLTDKCSNGADYFAEPVCETYLFTLQHSGYQVIGSSKWLNAICIENPDSLLTAFQFVSAVEPLGRYLSVQEGTMEGFSYGRSGRGLEMLKLDSFHKLGYTGEGVLMAVFDGGFTNVDSIGYFDSLWMRGQILAGRDFHNNSALSYTAGTHGMQVLSLIGANHPDSLIGAAPNAKFVLARTEVSYFERHIEEFYWIKAMEWADSIGVDIIHSSLGYSLFDSLQGDYSYTDMDGNSTIITIAAELAASRGIFITNSAGNSGAKDWRYITAPCDGEHVLCVGAVDSFEVKADFSSFGPSSDGRVKPDVMAMGVRNTVPNSKGILETGSGTSFAGPLIAGMVACLKQAHPTKTNKAIFQAIIMSADRYDIPDSGYGYGIPNVLRADSILRNNLNLENSLTESPQYTIWPNPANSRLKVQCEPGSTIRIMNASGVILLEEELLNLINFVDILDLPSGVLFISLNSGNSIQQTRILKY